MRVCGCVCGCVCCCVGGTYGFRVWLCIVWRLDAVLVCNSKVSADLPVVDASLSVAGPEHLADLACLHHVDPVLTRSLLLGLRPHHRVRRVVLCISRRRNTRVLALHLAHRVKRFRRVLSHHNNQNTPNKCDESPSRRRRPRRATSRID